MSSLLWCITVALTCSVSCFWIFCFEAFVNLKAGLACMQAQSRDFLWDICSRAETFFPRNLPLKWEFRVMSSLLWGIAVAFSFVVLKVLLWSFCKSLGSVSYVITVHVANFGSIQPQAAFLFGHLPKFILGHNHNSNHSTRFTMVI